jgi:hypothetical protein
MPKGFAVGQTHDCYINGKPARVTWRDKQTLVIEPDDPRLIVEVHRDVDGNVFFVCCERGGAEPSGCEKEFGDRYYNLGREHWAVCETYKYKWCFGDNLFSGWRAETEVDWERNAQILACYSDPPREQL